MPSSQIRGQITQVRGHLHTPRKLAHLAPPSSLVFSMCLEFHFVKDRQVSDVGDKGTQGEM